MDRKYLIWGGVGAAALVGGFLLLNRGGGAAESAAPAADGGYYPPSVFSSGGGYTSGDSLSGGGTTASAMDQNIASILAGQLATANLNADLTKFTVNAEKDVALAGYANSLAITKEQTNSTIMKGLADSLGGIVGIFQGSGSKTTVSNSNSSGFFGIGGGSKNSTTTDSYVQSVGGVKGSIGFKDGVISLDIAQIPMPGNTNIAVPPPPSIAAPPPAVAAPKPSGLGIKKG